MPQFAYAECAASVRRAVAPLLALALQSAAAALFSPAAVAADAEIVSLTGIGEAREQAESAWRLAAVRQKLHAGSFVRTGDLSQMALLLTDQTQLRLNQNSMLQLKPAAAAEPTRLELKVGRAWMQSKARPAAEAGARGAPAVVVETPNAVAAIRGTDWELAVEPNGTALLTVLSGEVEFFNEHGRVLVQPNEQARAEAGKAPVKLLLTSARDRVQWVTAYRPQPVRWAGGRPAALAAAIEAIEAGRLAEASAALERQRPASAAHAAVLADLLLSQGRVEEAIAALIEASRNWPADGRLAALLARAHLIAGRAAQAGQILAAARAAPGADAEVWIASGDLARYNGNAAEANACYRQALARSADHPNAWLGLGIVATGQEAVRPARAALAQALQHGPQLPGARGELGTLETFADNFGAAEAAFGQALQEVPDDYVALTGYGVLLLKRGATEAALQAFLKAGVIEPRYALAALYTGVAYYQLGRRDRAAEMFLRAAELDPKDPLPFLMLDVAKSDDMARGEAVDAARQAVARMPYLKSLNQVLTDQKGNADVGSGLAAFGLEEWAQSYAYQTYNPYWAGSHLFLADRFNGTFNKASELFQGFLTDPTVFGASNRFSSLIVRPGDYVTLAGTLQSQSVKAPEAQAVFNGYHNETVPAAYYFSVDAAKIWPSSLDLDAVHRTYTLGLGTRPRHDLGFFLYANDSRTDGTLSVPAQGLTGNPTALASSSVHLGANIKFAPDSQSWLKLGRNRETAVLGQVMAATGINTYNGESKSSDWQWRHTFDLNPRVQLSMGAEYGKQTTPVALLADAAAQPLGLREQTEGKSRDLYLSSRFRPDPGLLLQADLAWQRFAKDYRQTYLLGGLGAMPSASEARDIDELNPRLGIAWQVAGGATLRLAWQKWRRPSAGNTLGSVDTTGVALDDRLVALGGKLERTRAQLDWELGPRTFIQLFADDRKIDNLPNPDGSLASAFSLSDLDRLRTLSRINETSTDLYEDEPEVGGARVRSAGLAWNQILSARLSTTLKYFYHQGRDTAASGAIDAVPLLPRHALQVGATWIAMPRLQLSGLATYRSMRYTDETYARRLASGWNLGWRLYWEREDKKFSILTGAEDVLLNKDAGLNRDPFIGIQFVWRQ